MSGGWFKNLGLAEWMDLHWSGYPDFELDPSTGRPYATVLTYTWGKAPRTIDDAAAWDDIASGKFHWSERLADDDSTIAHPGDVYYAQFDFQTLAERDRFVKWHANRSQTK